MAAPWNAFAQSGVLLPGDEPEPDASVLSLEEMRIRISIDDDDARVSIVQIFANHTSRVKEGTYRFALPAGSTVSDFAVWDGPVRIPAAILERRRAEAVYDKARMQTIDPGLLENGEGDTATATNLFTARIVPIPAFGTKRLELEYHQHLSLDRYRQAFVLPLAPTEGRAQSAAHISLSFELHSSAAIKEATVHSTTLPLQLRRVSDGELQAEWHADDVALKEDLNLAWTFDPRDVDKLKITAYRNPEPADDRLTPLTKPASIEPGFFLARTLVGMPAASAGSSKQAPTPRDVVILFDTSLSMRWDMLQRSFAALEATLHGLSSNDRFSLLLFNQEVTAFRPEPTAASEESKAAALAFVRRSPLRGGTDLGKALSAGIKATEGVNASLLLLTDGDSDRGTSVLTKNIAADYDSAWKASPSHPRTTIFAVGDDANLPLLRQLATHNGVLEHVLSTEPIEAKLSAFLSHSVSAPLEGLHLQVEPAAAIHTLYPLEVTVYAGSAASWVGDYFQPATQLRFSVDATRDGAPLHAQGTADLPAKALDHPGLPRIWAQARVNALLDAVARDGESREAVAEIIQLSRQYKFVTPYTSFLAAPRSLLRPRVIRPGDPVLRVHTDPAIVSVVALFPFGLTQSLRHLAVEDRTHGADADRVWETRFLAPADMQDGVYTVRLILRDAAGHSYAEAKTFVIASTAPVVRVKLDRVTYRRGDIVHLRAQASATTRTLSAQIQGALPVALRWNSAAAANTGDLQIPVTLAPGTYAVSVTAEDIAHNFGTQEVRVAVLP